MAWRFNPPPGWPAPPAGWYPPPGWIPDPSWPPAPEGWQFWVEEPEPSSAAPGPGPAVGAPAGYPAPARRRSGCGGALLVLAVVVALLIAGGVALSVATWAGRSTETVDLSAEAPTGAVRVEHSCGPISLREGRPGMVSAEATIRYVWRKPVVTTSDQGGVVVVRVDCPWTSLGASVDLVVDVPPDGTVEARTSAGSVKAEGVSAALTLSSSAGSVIAADVTSPRVSAESSAGSVTVSVAPGADPSTISARSSAGSVTVEVPDLPGVSYAVDAGSSAGGTTVGVRTDPQSERTITARSSAGSVVVRYR